MSRDYAGHKDERKKTRAHTGGGQGLPGWLWAILGLSVGLCIAAVVFIVYRPLDDSGTQLERQPAGEAAKAAPDIPPHKAARFKFYDLLPKSEVQPSEEPYKPAPRDAAGSSDTRYIIQAGSFRVRSDAERRKANLALLGIESQVREVAVDGKGTRFRIQIGPAMGYEAAEKTMRLLADNDIDSFASRSSPID